MALNREIRNTADVAPSGTDIIAYWYDTPWAQGDPVADLILPMNGSIRHNIFRAGSGDVVKRVEVGFLRVSPGLRGNGMGERLAQGLGTLARKYDFNQIYACIASQYSLDILGNVFGSGNMSFFGREGSFIDLETLTASETPEPVEELNIDFELARNALSVLERVEKNPEFRVLGFPVTVGLKGLDMSGWELPVEFGSRAVSTD